MENAEVHQSWTEIGIDDWIGAGRWWLMKVGARLSFNSRGNSGADLARRRWDPSHPAVWSRDFDTCVS
jgi:hypothetical protein